MRDGGLSPGHFHGRLDENGSEWVRQLQNYCAFRGFDDDRALALMKVLLVDAAANWFESLDADSTKSYAALLKSFKTRYMPPAALKFRSAKELFSRRQQPNESTDQYIEAMSKLARQVAQNVSQSEDMARFAIMNGLKPAIASFVMQHEPNSLADVTKAARIAELTSDSTADDVSSQIQELHAKIDRMTAAASYEQPAGNAYTGGSRFYSATPGDGCGACTNAGQTGWCRHAYPPTTAEEYAQQGGQTYDQAYNQQYGQQYDGQYIQQYIQVDDGEQNAFDYTLGHVQAAQPAYQQKYQPAPRSVQPTCQQPDEYTQFSGNQCTKCGRRVHSRLQCPAVDRACYTCHRFGHFAACCRTPASQRIGPSNSNMTRRNSF